MLADIKSHNLPAIMGWDDHNVQQPKRSGRYDEQVDGGNTFGVNAQEATPRRRRRTGSSYHIGNRRLADLDAELEQLTMDSGRSPERVGGVPLPNQSTNLSI